MAVIARTSHAARRFRNRLPSLLMAPLLSCAAACTPGSGGESTLGAPGVTTTTITERDLRHRLGLVAHDSMGGRFTGSAGHVQATAYIANELSRLGLRPAGEDGTYYQAVPFLVTRHPDSHRLSVGGVRLEPMRDFVAIHPGGLIRSFDGAEVIFGGVLEDTTRRITREQAAGRFVILVYGDTTNTAGNIRTAEWDPRLREAVAIATVNPDAALARWVQSARRPRFVSVRDEDARRPAPAAMAISADAAEALLRRRADANVPLGTIGGVVHGETTFRTESLLVRNVVAVLPGSDPARAGEYVALGAHSDHLPFRGTPVNHDSLRLFNTLAAAQLRELKRPFLTAAERAAIRVDADSMAAIRPPRADSVHNGADDDGSGTVALLEVAEALAGAERAPARSILFVWHAAEEGGLIGSRFFTDHPTVPRDAIVSQINLDMIGRGTERDVEGGGPDYLQVIGWRRLSSELGDVIERVNGARQAPFSFDTTFDAPGHPERLYCRSDHYSYARFGIPVAFLTTGLHVDYHEVTDETQYIDYTKLTEVTGFVRDVAVTLAELGQRPALDAPAPDPSAPCEQ